VLSAACSSLSGLCPKFSGVRFLSPNTHSISSGVRLALWGAHTVVSGVHPEFPDVHPELSGMRLKSSNVLIFIYLHFYIHFQTQKT
jgi:hypothetical protein